MTTRRVGRSDVVASVVAMVGATGTVEGAASKLILALPQWQDGRVRATELTRARFRSVLCTQLRLSSAMMTIAA